MRRIFMLSMLVVFAVANTLAGDDGRLIVNDKLTIGAKQYRYIPFYSEGNSEVRGRFRAEGGSGNDIECVIMDEDSFENWRNGHRVNVYYNSGRVTVANVFARLPRGRFFLIFNNGFSLLSNKVVATHVRIYD